MHWQSTEGRGKEDGMSDDWQDFLERQEARRRRQQPSGQPPTASRPAQSAGQKPKARPSARSAEQSASVAAQAKAGQKPARLKAEKRQAPGSNPDDLEEPASVSRPMGRRAAARRQEVAAGLSPLPAGQKPSLLARLIIWGTAAICGMLLLASLGEAWTVHRLNQQIAANQQAADQLQTQNQQLARNIQQLQQASTIEQEARRLGFIFPGDQPVVVVTTPPPSTAAPPAAPPSSGWWGFWPDWLKLFFGG
jgi:hypothetical protein